MYLSYPKVNASCGLRCCGSRWSPCAFLLQDNPKYAFHTTVRRAYMQSFDFKNMSIVEALRTMLDGFRLPGEAQKIEVLVEEFAAVYVSRAAFAVSVQPSLTRAVTLCCVCTATLPQSLGHCRSPTRRSFCPTPSSC